MPLADYKTTVEHCWTLNLYSLMRQGMLVSGDLKNGIRFSASGVTMHQARPDAVRWKADEVEQWVSEHQRTLIQAWAVPVKKPPSMKAEDATARVFIPKPIRDALLPAADRRRIGLRHRRHG